VLAALFTDTANDDAVVDFATRDPQVIGQLWVTAR
jgi:hypothetical protein